MEVPLHFVDADLLFFLKTYSVIKCAVEILNIVHYLEHNEFSVSLRVILYKPIYYLVLYESNFCNIRVSSSAVDVQCDGCVLLLEGVSHRCKAHSEMPRISLSQLFRALPCTLVQYTFI